METQARFDLNAAIEKWRQELAAQPNLTPPDQRELEAHLRDIVAELQRRGLTEDESFWLARRRVGRPQQLAEEFVKANPAAIWRERITWIAVGAVGCYGLTTIQGMFSNLLDPFGHRTGIWLYLGLFVIPFLAFVTLAMMIRRGHVPPPLSYFERMPGSPRRLGSVLFVVLFCTVLFAYLSAERIGKSGIDMLAAGALIEMTQTWIFSATWPAMMILVVFLMPCVPTQNGKALESV